ncbi:1-acyl-sn-glycerol-3-phosphate acyltransferase [Belnapia sp. T6]|uniref:1-acyl-sn-glycerol-3-phosphate acyltransferase n=1 Tax=Belnapia mucosa TaxID=2804532 RepID=A0ABS1V5T4_9PROT|nr:lysophospholipid acyltransferase family protein [Belnapia mucosa]MBL6457050.1 1-acyl-sn-glycerol-3-phosphate acyltransferase [Belnapia mucosa]
MRPTSLRQDAEGIAPLDWLAALYYPVAFYFCLTLFGLSCLFWSLPASLLYRLLPKRSGEALGQFMIMAGFRWFIGVMRLTGVLRVDFSELDRLWHERSIVIAPNHPTMLDAVLVTSRLPRVVCITKAALWDNLFYGGSVRLAAYIRNDAPLPMIRRAAGAIRDGAQLLIFPEGSRTAAPPIDAFHRSFAVMARAAGAPVQTLLIEADSPYLRKGWPLFRRPQLPLTYRIRLGRRFEVGEDPQAFVTGLEAYFREELPKDRPA